MKDPIVPGLSTSTINADPAVDLNGWASPPETPANIVTEPNPAVAGFATDSLIAVISPVMGTVPEITTEPRTP